jgi:hypothetical protein
MSNLIETTGKIIYDPFRGGMKRRTEGWCIVSIDTEITRYYRWWLKYQYHIHLQPPSWDAHVSCVRGEKISSKYQHNWKKHHNQVIALQYEHGSIETSRSGRIDSNNDGQYYYIKVISPTITDIRNELGLNTFHSYHLTIGRTYEYVARHELRKQHRR